MIQQFPPRTITDVRRLQDWISDGVSFEEIKNRISKKGWRTELITLPSGRFQCAECFKIISLAQCFHCGEPKESET
jgi:hypothetical protein